MDYRKLRCTKLLGGDCSFVAKGHTAQETMHILMGHTQKEHSDITIDEESMKKKMEENLE